MKIPLNPKLFDADVEQAPIPNQQISWLGHKHQQNHVLDGALARGLC